MSEAGLRCEAVIATRNRQDALELSLPLLLGQSRPPHRVIVVDASDDHDATRRAIDACRRPEGPEIALMRGPRGAALQRNLGLAEVEAEITLFPDDDSLLLPGALAAIMEVYERDADGQVAAVCARETFTPPAALLAEARARYEIGPVERLRRAVAMRRARLEAALFPDPFVTLAERSREGRSPPDWLDACGAVVVDRMPGFRMSFRTAAIRETGFDATLADYSLFEDNDACLAAGRKGWLLGALRAEIYHHRAPGGRADPFRLGAMQVLNRAYVQARHDGGDPALRRAFHRFVGYKAAVYAAAAPTREGRARLRGALAGWSRARAVFDAPAAERAERYRAELAACLSR